jgi:hypothetical protein
VLKFLLKLLIVSGIAGVVYYSLGEVLPSRFYFSQFYWLLLLFIGITFLFHYGLQRNFEKGSKDFIRYYMGATGARLFFFLTIILIYGFLHKESAVGFALGFFFFYLIFTVFEVIVSFNKFGRSSNDAKTNQANISGN